MLGLLTGDDENLAKSLTEPLPLAENSEEEGDAEEQELIITSRTPSYIPLLNEVDQ